jgi:hypothetical protein
MSKLEEPHDGKRYFAISRRGIYIYALPRGMSQILTDVVQLWFDMSTTNPIHLLMYGIANFSFPHPKQSKLINQDRRQNHKLHTSKVQNTTESSSNAAQKTPHTKPKKRENIYSTEALSPPVPPPPQHLTKDTLSNVRPDPPPAPVQFV